MAVKKSRKTKRRASTPPTRRRASSTRRKARRARPAKRTARSRRASPARKAVARKPAPKRAVPRKAAPKKAKTRPAKVEASRGRPTPPVTLARDRRQLSSAERFDSGSDERLVASARAGHDALRHHIEQHTETSPELTAGDVDAHWEDAYAIGDEAPGGDNPTPDQDRVDDIGKAFGIEYENSDDLLGGDELAERDKHRWELDPASADDWPHDKLK